MALNRRAFRRLPVGVDRHRVGSTLERAGTTPFVVRLGVEVVEAQDRVQKSALDVVASRWTSSDQRLDVNAERLWLWFEGRNPLGVRQP